jgi:hypothetical protein
VASFVEVGGQQPLSLCYTKAEYEDIELGRSSRNPVSQWITSPKGRVA